MSEPLSIVYVGRDGCYVLEGIRVRAAPGVPDVPGSLADEAERGIRTPLDGEDGRASVLSCCPDHLREFVMSLPVAQWRPL